MKKPSDKENLDAIIMNPKVVLSFLAQQYGLTAEDVAQRHGCDVADVQVQTEAEAKAAGFI